MTDDIDDIDKHIRKSERSLKAARILFEEGDYDFAISRSYYAMFYMAQALLFRRGLVFSKHASVISGFYQEFVKTGKLDSSLHQAFHKSFEVRQEGDYFVDFVIEEGKTLEFLEKAQDFLIATKKLLKE